MGSQLHRVPRTFLALQMHKGRLFAKVQLGVSVGCRLVLGVSDDSLAKESLREAAHITLQELQINAIRTFTFIDGRQSCEIQALSVGHQ